MSLSLPHTAELRAQVLNRQVWAGISATLSTETYHVGNALPEDTFLLPPRGLVARIEWRTDLRPEPSVYAMRTDCGAPSARS